MAARQGEAGSAATASRISRLSPEAPCGQQHEGHQQEGFAKQGERHVDQAARRARGVPSSTISP